MEEVEEAKQQAQTATHAFNAVRQARFDAFMKAFTHISAGIDRIFKVALPPPLSPPPHPPPMHHRHATHAVSTASFLSVHVGMVTSTTIALQQKALAILARNPLSDSI